MSQPLGFPGGASGKQLICRSRRYKRWGFEPWVRKIPWRKAWQPTLVYFTGGFLWTEDPDRLYSPWGHKDLGTTEAI